jgi:hypothetical protein
MNKWSWYWLIWFIVMFPISFLIPELIALSKGQPENTLSANVWRLEQAAPGQTIFNWTAIHVLLGGFLFVLLVWLAFHLVFRIWH